MYKTGTVSVYREQLALNGSSYSAVPGTDSDDFRTASNIQGLPANNTHKSDAVAYSTPPTYDNWTEQLAHGNQT